MTYRIYDEKVLDTTEGNFKISLDVSKSYDVKNPDGSSPEASLEIKSETMRHALVLLTSIREKDYFSELILEESFEALAESNPEALVLFEKMSDPELDEATVNGLFDQIQPLYLEYMDSNKDWVTLEVTTSGVMEGVDGDKEITADFTLHAPGYKIMDAVVNEMISSRRLNSIVSNLMPFEDDEDDFSHYEDAEDED